MICARHIIANGFRRITPQKNSPRIDPAVFKLGIPVLGVCYGMQFMISALGGSVKRADRREYGFAELQIKRQTGIFEGIQKRTQCWMSHGDSIQRLPRGFSISAATANTRVAAAAHRSKPLIGVQFHPEVAHTLLGKKMLRNFMFKICGCKRSWTMRSFARDAIENIRWTVGPKKVILDLL